MITRVATSDLYRDSPTRVRCAWAFADFIGAHVVLDAVDEDRARQRANAEARGHGR